MANPANVANGPGNVANPAKVANPADVANAVFASVAGWRHLTFVGPPQAGG
ncbi:MAG: hypothetical protein ABSF95_13745 [Verrucomicrobiota bacterium]